MTKIEKLAREQFGSLRKMMILSNLKPGTVYPVISGYRRSWPKLRNQLSKVLKVEEVELFDENGWPVLQTELVAK